MATTICDICNGAVSEDDLRGQLKVGTVKMTDCRRFDVCIECVNALTKSCRKMVASPFWIFVDEEGKVKDTRQ